MSSLNKVYPLTDKHVAESVALSRLMGWNQVEEDWRMLINISDKGCMGVFEDGALIGTVGTIRYAVGVGFINMLLVHPDHQGKGVGKQLLAAAMDLLKDERSIQLDATAQGRLLYQQLGFKDVFAVSRMIREKQQGVPHKPIVSVETLDEQGLTAIGALDNEVFGADRMKVLREIVRRNSALCLKISDAYCLAREGDKSVQIGPIVSHTDAHANSLVESQLYQLAEYSVTIDIMEEHASWKQWLISKGFRAQRSFMRMVRGDSGGGKPQFQFATAGPELG